MPGSDKTILSRLKKFFKVNPGAAFIVAFQVLLISAGILLAFGASNPANEIADYAFYALVIGVVVQIGVAIQEERKSTRAGRTDTSSAST